MTMPKLREVTEADRRQWQLNVAQALTELMSMAATEGLPILAWKVTPLGLLGEVPCSYGRRNEDAEYQTWVAYLDATAVRAARTGDGVLHVRSSVSYRIRRGRDVQVTIAANLRPEPQALFRESA